MSNKSLFVQAAEKAVDAGAKLASLSDIYTRQPMVDPLDNPSFGPKRMDSSVPSGRHIGQLIGGLGGMAAGGYLGHELGGGLTSGIASGAGALHELVHGEDPVGTGAIHDALSTFGHVSGTIEGGVAGGLVGHAYGGRVGAGIARLGDKFFGSPEARAAEKVKHMDPSTALAHIHMTEQLGHESPSVIKAMKDSYNTRRTGLQAQLGAGVAIPPGETPSEVTTTMKPKPF